MSKQSDAKEKQGFLKKCPNCSNCKNFTLDKQEKKNPWSIQSFTVESNLRCAVGGFKVGKSNWCQEHKFNA